MQNSDIEFVQLNSHKIKKKKKQQQCHSIESMKAIQIPNLNKFISNCNNMCAIFIFFSRKQKSPFLVFTSSKVSIWGRKRKVKNRYSTCLFQKRKQTENSKLSVKFSS